MDIGIPVISVGNATVGGAGKTPVAIKISTLLIKKYPDLAVISRGYGGKIKGPVMVDSSIHSAADVGDEPLLIAKSAPCWIAKNRLSGAKAAVRAGADLIILDDGLQNNSIKKSFSLLVVDGDYGFGNNFLFPAGPLREPVSQAIEKSHAVIFFGEKGAEKFGHLPIFRSALQPEAKIPAKKHEYLAFAGIGRPEKFFKTLEGEGYKIAAHEAFADHHNYSDEELKSLEHRAKKLNARLITTEKDLMRLPPDFARKIFTLPVAAEIEDEKALLKLLENKI